MDQPDTRGCTWGFGRRLKHPLGPLRHPAQGRGRRGTTLIELLIVVSIVALMAAILVPSVLRARRQTKRTICKAYAYQIGRVDRCQEARLRLEAYDCGCYGELGRDLGVFTIPDNVPETLFRAQLEAEVFTACRR